MSSAESEKVVKELITQTLKMQYGTTASFRPGQLEVMVDVWHRRNDVLALQPTGYGKSLLYQLPAFAAACASTSEEEQLMHTGSLTIVVCPLLALLRTLMAPSFFLPQHLPPGYRLTAQLLKIASHSHRI